MFLCGNLAIGQFELLLCGNWAIVYFLPQPIFSVDFLTFFWILVICFCVETELLVNLNCFCVKTELWFWICLVETKRGGVISLLPDNLNKIGVEYFKVSYSLHCSLNYVFLFLFFFPFSLQIWGRFLIVGCYIYIYICFFS